jgi:hypothetical protein
VWASGDGGGSGCAAATAAGEGLGDGGARAVFSYITEICSRPWVLAGKVVRRTSKQEKKQARKRRYRFNKVLTLSLFCSSKADTCRTLFKQKGVSAGGPAGLDEANTVCVRLTAASHAATIRCVRTSCSLMSGCRSSVRPMLLRSSKKWADLPWSFSRRPSA